MGGGWENVSNSRPIRRRLQRTRLATGLGMAALATNLWTPGNTLASPPADLVVHHAESSRPGTPGPQGAGPWQSTGWQYRAAAISEGCVGSQGWFRPDLGEPLLPLNE